MRRYKLLAVHILLILSVFNFVQVLAAPVPVPEVREACADMEDGGEDVIIASWKRAEDGQEPSSEIHGSTQASPGSGSESDVSGGELPWYSSSGMRRPPYASGGTKLPWYSSGGGAAQLAQPGTTSKTLLASSMRTKTSKDRWMAASSVRTKTNELAPASKISLASSVRTKPNKWVATTEIEPGSSSSGQIIPASSNKGLPLSEQTASSSDLPGPVSKPDQLSALSHNPSGSPLTSDHASGVHQETTNPSQLPSPASGDTTPVSSPSKVFPPPELEGHLAQTPIKQPKPQFNSFLSKLASKSKSLFGQLVSKSKSLFGHLTRISKGWVSEMVANPKLQLRSSAAISGTVNAAQRELQGTVHIEAVIL